MQVVILDDCFSALDAHVTTHIFDHAVRGSLKGRTILLVTHALHLLSRSDYIYVLNKGRIDEEGSYNQLVGNGGSFAELIKGHGSQEQEIDEEKIDHAAADLKIVPVETNPLAMPDTKAAASLMNKEERAIGRVGFPVWRGYFAFANGKVFLPLLLCACIVMQGALLMTSYWLVFWQERTFDQPQGF